MSVTVSGNAIIQVIERWAREVVSSYFHMEGIVASGVQDRNCVIKYSGDRLSTSYHCDANFYYRHNRTQTITVRFFTIC